MERKDIIRVLQALPLFAHTPHDVLETVLQDDRARLQETPPHTRIDRCDTPELGILLSGKAQIRSADEEKTVILRTVSAGEIFDAALLFLDSTVPVSRIEAIERCQTLFLSAPLVRELMQLSPAFLDAYLALLAARVQFLNQKIRCFTAGSAERRLALFLAANGGEGATLTVSLTKLADILDIGRASLYRALDKLESEGLIRHDGRRITLVSLDALLKKYQ